MLFPIKKIITFMEVMGTPAKGFNGYVYKDSRISVSYDRFYGTLVIDEPDIVTRIEDIRDNDMLKSAVRAVTRCADTLFYAHHSIDHKYNLPKLCTEFLQRSKALAKKDWIVLQVKDANAFGLRNKANSVSYFMFLDSNTVLIPDQSRKSSFAEIVAEFNLLNIAKDIESDELETVPVPVALKRIILYTCSNGRYSDSLIVYRCGDYLLSVEPQALWLNISKGDESYTYTDIHVLDTELINVLSNVYSMIRKSFDTVLQVDVEFIDTIHSVIDGREQEQESTCPSWLKHGVRICQSLFLDCYVLSIDYSHEVLYEGQTGNFYAFSDATLPILQDMVNKMLQPDIITFGDAIGMYAKVHGQEVTMELIDHVLQLCGVNVEKITEIIKTELL